MFEMEVDLKKIVVFTALFGSYDQQLLEVDYDHNKFDFVCFTNQKRLKSKTWDIRVVDDPVPNDNPRSSYYYKTNPHLIWGEQYEMSIWMDSSCNKLDVDKLYKMAEKFDGLGTALYIEKHPGRTCIYKELEANIHYKKDDEAAMRAHIDAYRKEGMPAEFGMCETGLQFRKHNNPDVIEFQELLWNEMTNKTRRDQLSWTYCQWKLNFKNFSLFTFQEKVDVLWFEDHPHRANHKEKVLLVGPFYGDPDLEKEWIKHVENYLGRTPVDTVIVGCRPGREDLYKSITPDRFIIQDPEGEINRNLLNNKVPRFSVKVTGEKEVIQLNPTSDICDEFKSFDRSKSRIHVLWCTIRPEMFKKTFDDWADKCKNYITMGVTNKIPRFIPHVAVDTEEQANELRGGKTTDIIVVDNKRPGVTYPSYKLAQHVLLNQTHNGKSLIRDEDIIVFASDDFYPMENWDEAILKEFEKYEGALLVNDCYGQQGKNLVSIPIMTVKTLKKLNGIIYHPAYIHCHSDNELYDNLKEMNLIKDISITKPEIYFEHRHFSNGKRELDDIDRYHQQTDNGDRVRYNQRKSFPLKAKLEVKKVISFSLWGDGAKYLNGAIANIKLAKQIYPDWICRFYYDCTVPNHVVNELKSLGAEMVLKDEQVGSKGMSWRFEVGYDEEVDRFIIRDTDSRLNMREKIAVDEWIQSGKPFHTMRDHKNHGVSILGGMWGATKGFISNFKELHDKWVSDIPATNHNRDTHFNSDQIFLWQTIWPLVKSDHIAHDDRFKFTGDEKPFIHKLENNMFVGQAFDEFNKPIFDY